MIKNIQMPVASALIKDNNGRILLQRRADSYIPDANGKWEFTGGKVNFGENPIDAVVRECAEEIGCRVHVSRLIPYIHTNIWQRADGSQAQALIICYEVKIISGTPKPVDKKLAEVKWFTRQEIKKLDVLPGINELIDFSYT